MYSKKKLLLRDAIGQNDSTERSRKKKNIDYLRNKREWVLKENFKILILARSEPQTVGCGVISMNKCSPAASLRGTDQKVLDSIPGISVGLFGKFSICILR